MPRIVGSSITVRSHTDARALASVVLTQERPGCLVSHSVSAALGVRQQHWAASDGLCTFKALVRLAGSSGCSRQRRAAARRRSATPAFASLHCSDPIRPWPSCRSTAATMVVSCVAKCLPVMNPDRGPVSVPSWTCFFRHNTTPVCRATLSVQRRDFLKCPVSHPVGRCRTATVSDGVGDRGWRAAENAPVLLPAVCYPRATSNMRQWDDLRLGCSKLVLELTQFAV
ncbi:hypothetical protein HDV57DRAFT_389884 [Trichoderma longibrachiatum]